MLVLDSMRSLIVWALSIAVGWQTFHCLQLLGFAFLIAGMCMYNEIVPKCRRRGSETMILYLFCNTMPHCGSVAAKDDKTEVGL